MESAWGLDLMEHWGLKSAHRVGSRIDPTCASYAQNGSRARWAYPGTTGHPRASPGVKGHRVKVSTTETPARPGWAGPFVV